VDQLRDLEHLNFHHAVTQGFVASSDILDYVRHFDDTRLEELPREGPVLLGGHGQSGDPLDALPSGVRKHVRHALAAIDGRQIWGVGNPLAKEFSPQRVSAAVVPPSWSFPTRKLLLRLLVPDPTARPRVSKPIVSQLPILNSSDRRGVGDPPCGHRGDLMHLRAPLVIHDPVVMVSDISCVPESPFARYVSEGRNTMKACDIIGDIHGHAEELEELLNRLGYRESGGTRRHPDGRRVIFLGDYIDRGPEIRSTLEIVRGMVDAREALAILGNHEINALRFHTKGEDGGPLRPHTKRVIAQHAETLRQIPDEEEMAGWLRWFSELPLTIQLPGLRVVHAAWDAAAIQSTRKLGPFSRETLLRTSEKGTPIYERISRLVNGPEARLPDGYTHMAADGNLRRDIRVKWWMSLRGLNCRQIIFPDSAEVPELPPKSAPALDPYDNQCPVFFGHYALKLPAPMPQTAKIACLDYGIGKGGFLCAYRWDGEQEIDPAKFVSVPARKISEKNPATPNECPTPPAKVVI